MENTFSKNSTSNQTGHDLQGQPPLRFAGFSTFRSFSAGRQAPEIKAGIRTRGIPSEAIAAQLAHERTHSSTLERPKYRSFTLPSDASATTSAFGSAMGGMTLGQPALLRSQFRSSSVPSPSFTRSFDPFSKPKFRGMTIPKPAAPVIGARGVSVDSSMGGLRMMRPALDKKSPAVTVVGRAPSASPDAVVVPSLPGAPYELERHTSFFTTRSHPEVKKFMDATLDSAGADFEFKSHKCKWKVFAFIGNQSAKVVVKLFQISAPEEGAAAKFAIEVQRRKGDPFAFFGWYRDLYNEFVKSGFVTGEDGVAQRETLKPAFDVRQGDRVQPVPVVQRDDLVPLMNMAKNPFEDVQAEAIREIAKLMTNSENHKSFESADYIGIVSDLLKSQNYDVNRCAATAIACVAQTCTVAKKLAEHGVVADLCEFLENGGKLERKLPERQSQRESARALGEILKVLQSQAQPRADPCMQRARQVLTRVKDHYCHDKRLQEVCGRALCVA